MMDASDVNAVERSIRAVTAIRQVVHAIWALSRAQLPLVEQAARAAVTYQRWIDATVERVASVPPTARAERKLTIVFGPERPYSASLVRRITDAVPEDGDLGIVGERLAEAVSPIASVARRVRFRCSGSVAHDDLHEVALSVAVEILEHGRGATVVVMHATDDDRELAIVPLIAERTLVDRPPETLSPLADVLESAVAAAMIGRLAVAAAESLRAETRARIAAADAARRACDERLADLENVWHFGRRETVTRELLEIVAGREAATLGQEM